MMTDESTSAPVAICVDQDRCASCGMCSAIAPGVFESDPKSYKAKVKTPLHLDAEKLSEAKNAAESCPTQSITISQ